MGLLDFVGIVDCIIFTGNGFGHGCETVILLVMLSSCSACAGSITGKRMG
jgi:hypothetical protein